MILNIKGVNKTALPTQQFSYFGFPIDTAQAQPQAEIARWLLPREAANSTSSYKFCSHGPGKNHRSLILAKKSSLSNDLSGTVSASWPVGIVSVKYYQSTKPPTSISTV